ncbi:hypothetical protein DPM19_15750 [Actinomadura craniellae]|uniref:Uncharacterized protein n=2 Tax=Actinomadura craniellae TaxID=2231787 RepID=A0A365H5M8_9ACTN|nr:hypothetical protein DPM19_15750 [Actinomadura craniellae]
MLLGDIPSTDVIREAKAERVHVTPAFNGENVPHFLDLAARGLRDREAVVVLYPTWRPEAATRLIRFARGILRTDRIAAVPLALPPLALSLVADQLAFMAPHVAPGVLVSVAHRLAAGVFAGAWVNSVTKLEHVQAGIGEHVSSYLTRTGFMVSAVPWPNIHRITSAHPVAPIQFRPLDPVIVLATQQDGDADWLQSRFQPAIGAVSMTFTAHQPLSSAYWGTRKYAEFVAFSGHQQALQNVIKDTQCRRCSWCSEPTALSICPFCFMAQPQPSVAPTRQQPAAQAAAPRSAPPADGSFGPAPPQGDTGPPSAGVASPAHTSH